MTYIDPNIYDWRKLKDEEADYMRGYNWCMEDVETAFGNFIVDDTDEESTMAKIKCEILEETQQRLAEWLDMERTELTCSLMESNLDKYGEE